MAMKHRESIEDVKRVAEKLTAKRIAEYQDELQEGKDAASATREEIRSDADATTKANTDLPKGKK
jgi:hypothetical protein